MTVLNFENYKDFLKYYIKSLPKKGHGESAKFAKAMRVNSTMVSQILNGSSHMNQEQALRLAKHIALNEIETEYFMNLVLFNRAGDKETENYYRLHLQKLKLKNQNIQERLNLKSDISEADQAQYYSHWQYSAIWLLSAIEKYQTRESLTQFLQMPKDVVGAAIDFLVRTGLVQEENGKVKIKGEHIHIGAESPLVRRHHNNWRSVAMNHIERKDLSRDLFFTGPMVIESKHAEVIKEIVLKALADIQKISGPSGCEELYCLNLDWFKV